MEDNINQIAIHHKSGYTTTFTRKIPTDMWMERRSTYGEAFGPYTAEEVCEKMQELLVDTQYADGAGL